MQNPLYCPQCGQNDGWIKNGHLKECMYCPPLLSQKPQPINLNNFTDTGSTISYDSLETNNTFQPPSLDLELNKETIVVPKIIFFSSLIAGICLLFIPTVRVVIRYSISYDWGISTYTYNWDYGCFDHIILGIMFGPSGLGMLYLCWKSFKANKGLSNPPTKKLVRRLAIVCILMMILVIPLGEVIAEEELSPGESVEGVEPTEPMIIVIICCVLLYIFSYKLKPHLLNKQSNIDEHNSVMPSSNITSQSSVLINNFQPNLNSSNNSQENVSKLKQCNNCNFQNFANMSICKNCQKNLGGTIIEKFLWFILVFFTTTQIVCTIFGLYFNIEVIKWYAIFSVLSQIITGAIILSEGPIWIRRAYKSLKNIELNQTKSTFILLLIYRISILGAVIYMWKSRTGLYGSEFFNFLTTIGFNLVSSHFFTFSFGFFVLPVFGFLISFFEIRFLIYAPNNFKFLSKIANDEKLKRIWDSGAFMVVGLLSLMWSITDLLLSLDSLGVWLTMVVAPILMLLSLREVPKYIGETNKINRSMMIIPLYLIILAGLPISFSIGLINSGTDTLSMLVVSQFSAFLNLSLTDCLLLTDSLENVILIGEIFGISAALIFLLKTKEGEDYRMKITRKGVCISYAIAFLLITPLAFVVCTATLDTPNYSLITKDISQESEENYLVAEIQLFAANYGDDEFRIWFLIPDEYYWDFNQWDPFGVELEVTLESYFINSNGINTEDFDFPIGTYFYGEEWANLPENSVIAAVPLDLNFEPGYTYANIYFYIDIDVEPENFWMMSVLEFEGEYVDWSAIDNRYESLSLPIGVLV